jgi:hypothetical protein
MPVTLATQEAEIRRMEAQSQPQANGFWDPICKVANEIFLKYEFVALFGVFQPRASKYPY